MNVSLQSAKHAGIQYRYSCNLRNTCFEFLWTPTR